MAPTLWGFLLAPRLRKTMPNENNVIDELLREIAGLIHEYPKAIERRAAEIQATGKDPDLVEKLVKAADTMRDSGNLYITWAKHFAALAEGNTDASSDEDETEDFDI
jgi:phosphoenolpyruvate synthase/pyruvate phosphate dikinase